MHRSRNNQRPTGRVQNVQQATMPTKENTEAIIIKDTLPLQNYTVITGGSLT